MFVIHDPSYLRAHAYCASRPAIVKPVCGAAAEFLDALNYDRDVEVCNTFTPSVLAQGGGFNACVSRALANYGMRIRYRILNATKSYADVIVVGKQPVRLTFGRVKGRLRIVDVKLVGGV